MTTQVWEIGLIMFGSVITGTAPIFIKRGMEMQNNFDLLKIATNKNLIIGIMIYVVAYFIMLPALKEGDLSILYPCASVGYIWSSFLSVKYLNENMTKLKWIGIFVIICGVTLIGIGR